MRSPEDLLLAALQAAPRPYRLPPLPVDADAARASGVDVALAYALEAARVARHHDVPAPAGVQPLFTWALARAIAQALAPEGGDPAFQAVVLQARDPDVKEHVHLAAHAHGDRRAVRTLTDAIAHPGKTRRLPPGPLRDALEQLHGLATTGAWAELHAAVTRLLHRVRGDGLRAALEAIVTDPALRRLERSATLDASEGVRRYRALCERRGPLAGSEAAAAKGRAAKRVGASAEAATVHAFRAIAALLTQAAHDAAHYRVLRSLRMPRGFPGEVAKAKEEWDAAIVREAAEGAHVVLLAEVKASPAAATPDFPRLLRGLQRLAHAAADQAYAFPTDAGEVRIAGASLRGLRPHGRALPAQVLYCCAAPPESEPGLLAASSKAVLLAEPASLAFAQQLVQGTTPQDDALAPAWEALLLAPRLRSALHQYETAQAVRAAMVHPDDLLQAVERALGQTVPAG